MAINGVKHYLYSDQKLEDFRLTEEASTITFCGKESAGYILGVDERSVSNAFGDIDRGHGWYKITNSPFGVFVSKSTLEFIMEESNKSVVIMLYDECWSNPDRI